MAPGEPAVMPEASRDSAVELAIRLLQNADHIVSFLAACAVGVDVPRDVAEDARELLDAVVPRDPL